LRVDLVTAESKDKDFGSHSLLIKPTDALNSSFIGVTTLHVSGSLSPHHQEFLDYMILLMMGR
jgi:hypothetical protein